MQLLLQNKLKLLFLKGFGTFDQYYFSDKTYIFTCIQCDSAQFWTFLWICLVHYVYCSLVEFLNAGLSNQCKLKSSLKPRWSFKAASWRVISWLWNAMTYITKQNHQWEDWLFLYIYSKYLSLVWFSAKSDETISSTQACKPYVYYFPRQSFLSEQHT